MNDIKNRRPLKVRNAKFSKNFARWLSSKNITPNQISITSVFFALLAAGCLVSLPYVTSTWKWLPPTLAALFIQCRLLCNLFDGMVAVEGGKSTASGELFNDIPDRIADPIILIAAGYSYTHVSWAEAVGWCAGLFAVLTAYVRILSASTGAPMSFQGPMAKQHRMALMTFACILTAFEGFVWQQGYILLAALMLIVFGCVITIWRRVNSTYQYLERNQNV